MVKRIVSSASRAIVVVVWIAIIGLSLYFFLDNVVAYFFGYRSPMFGQRFFHNQVWVVAHMAGGTFTLLLGPLQFIKVLRVRWPSFHRLSGMFYMTGMAFAGASALRLSLISSCVPCRVSLFLLAVFALLTTALAWKAIRTNNIRAHQQHMVRSYICVLAFVAVRVDDIVPLDFLFGVIEDPVFRRVVNEYFFSFVPLLMAEIFLTWIPAAYQKLPRRAI